MATLGDQAHALLHHAEGRGVLVEADAKGSGQTGGGEVVVRGAQAAADAGRAAPRIVASLPVCVTDDVEGTRRRAAETFALYNTLPSYRKMMDKEGVAGPADLAIVGDEAEVRERLLELKAIGVDDFNAAIVAVDAEEWQRTVSVMREAR